MLIVMYVSVYRQDYRQEGLHGPGMLLEHVFYVSFCVTMKIRLHLFAYASQVVHDGRNLCGDFFYSFSSATIRTTL